MISKIFQFDVGQKVRYFPWDGCPTKLIENGIVKSFNENDLTTVFVVYKCGGDWENYQNYTGASTSTSQLEPGWK